MGNDLATLREKTVLCRVTGNAYGMTRVDRLAKARAVQDGALPANTTVKIPTAPEFAKVHAELIAAQYAARSVLRELSMSYGDDEGWRVLPHALMTEFLQGFAVEKARFNTTLSELKVKVIPTMVTLGHVYDETDAKASADVDAKASAIASAYTLTWRMQDYASGLFAGLPERSSQTLVQRYEADMARVVAALKLEPAQRLAVPVRHLAERLRVYKDSLADENARVSLRSSMVENVKSAVRMARIFSLFADNILDSAILEQADALAGCNVASLREGGGYLTSVLSMADGIHRRIADRTNNPYLTLTG